jgi:acyl-CoA synthetase (AMP-forming)/AMP-acid ligase II
MRTDSILSGYLNDEDATNAAFENGNWYRTGDVARLDDDGYLFIVDRLKDMIITGGENVYSKELEVVLSRHRRSLRLPWIVDTHSALALLGGFVTLSLIVLIPYTAFSVAFAEGLPKNIRVV